MTSTSTKTKAVEEAERCERVAKAELAKCEGCQGICCKELAEDRYWQPVFENGEWTSRHCQYYIEPKPADIPETEAELDNPLTPLEAIISPEWLAQMQRQLAEKKARLKPQYESKYGRTLTDEEYRKIENAEHKLKECRNCNGHYCLKGNLGWLPYHYPRITVNSNGVTTEMVLCDVWRKVAYKEQCDKAGIPRKYSKLSFDDYEVTNENADAVKLTHWFLRNPKKGLYLYGGAGTGKTFLASLIACEHIRNYKRLIFGDVPELLERIKRTFGKTSWEGEDITLNGDQLLKRYCKAPLIILDDFGAGQISEWVVGTLYHIINERYNNDRVTIVTSNYDLDGLGERLSKFAPFGGRRIISRLKEMTYQAFLGTTDRRI